MIDDMAALKQAMEQMDAEDPDEAQAAKERAAQTLSDAGLSFSRIAELVEQRRLLLRPRIVSGIKRMDQPGMLGDAAFRDAGSALRREGQSFRQIAEAIEFSTRPASSPAARYLDPSPVIEPPHDMPSEPLHEMADAPEYQMMGAPVYDMPDERPRERVWTRALLLVGSTFLFPLRHPIRTLAIAFVAYLLAYIVNFVSPNTAAAIRDGANRAVFSVSSFFDERISPRSKDIAAVHAAPEPTPSPTASSTPMSATPSAPPASAPPVVSPAPSANTSAPATSSRPAPPLSAPLSAPLAPPQPSAAPASPPASPPRRETRSALPSRPAVDCDRYPSSRSCAPFEEDRSRSLDDVIPERMRRRSRIGGPCVAGIGGCYWGGIHY